MLCNDKQMEEILASAKWSDIGALPSQGIPYQEKYGVPAMGKMYIKPFELSQLRLLSKARATGNMEHIHRAVDTCISYPVHQLTLGDYYYVLLWLRMYSMPKTPYTMTWDCNQVLFKHKETKQLLTYEPTAVWPDEEIIEKDYVASPCGMSNAMPVHQSNIEILTLEEDFELPEPFQFPRVAIAKDREDAQNDPEMMYLVDQIQWLPGKTWAQKVDYANNNFEDFQLAKFINEQVDFGIKESVQISCGRCKVAHTHSIRLDPAAFFQ